MSLKNAEKKKNPSGASLDSSHKSTDDHKGKNISPVSVRIRSRAKPNSSTLQSKIKVIYEI